MSVIKLCVGKMTIPFFTDIALDTKILGHITGNVQQGCHNAFRQPGPLFIYPQSQRGVIFFKVGSRFLP